MQINHSKLLGPEGAANAAAPTGTADAGTPAGGELFEQPSTAGADSSGESGGASGASGQGEVSGEPAKEAIRTPGLTKEEITEILRDAGLGNQQPASAPAAQQQPPPQLTSEQFNQMFRVWQPSADHLAQLRSEDPQVAMKAYEMMRDGLVRQAMTMAEYRVQQLIENTTKEFSLQLEPITQYVTEAQATAFRDAFYEKYPDLVPYEKLADSVSAKLTAQGFHGKTRDEVMEKFASETRAIVKDLLANAGGNGANGNGQQQPTAPKGRKMSTLTGGGQTGGPRGQGQQKPAIPGLEVFE
jgi:hypothetical protein